MSNLDQIFTEWSSCSNPRRAAEIAVQLGEERLVHQGSPSNEALSAVPKLFRLLSAPVPLNKEDVLLVLARIAVGVPERYWNLYTPRGELAGFTRRRGLPGSCYRAVAKRKDEFIQSLKNPEPMARAAAALALGLFPSSTSGRKAILERLGQEKDERVRFALYLCLVIWWWAFGKRTAPGFTVLSESKPLAILGLAVSQAYSTDFRDEASRKALIRAVTDPPEGFDARRNLPLDARRIAFEALKTGWPTDGRKVAMDGVRKGVFDSAEAVGLVFSLPPRPPSTWSDLLIPKELPPKIVRYLRELARVLKNKNGSWIPLPLAKATGLPSDVLDFRRWIGVDPAGPWEKLLPGTVQGKREKWPAYRWFRRAALGRIRKNDLLKALNSIVKNDELLNILLQAAGTGYDLFYAGKWTWADSVEVGIEIIKSRPLPIKSLKRRILDKKINLWRALLLARTLQLALKAEGKEIPEWADPAIRIACENRDPLRKTAREVLASLPPNRRDAILLTLELPYKIELRPSMWGRVVSTDAKGWGYLDLSGDRIAAAKRAVAAISQWMPTDPPSYRLPADEAAAVMRSFGKIGVPIIAAAMPGATDTGKAVLGPVLEALLWQSKAKTARPGHS